MNRRVLKFDLSGTAFKFALLGIAFYGSVWMGLPFFAEAFTTFAPRDPPKDFHLEEPRFSQVQKP
jgi:hypothetical protein